MAALSLNLFCVWLLYLAAPSTLTSFHEKEDEMLALPFILADGVTIKLGDNVWTFGLNFIIYLIVAAVVGLVAESLVGWRVPFGFFGVIIAALGGAIILVGICQLLTCGLERGRSRDA